MLKAPVPFGGGHINDTYLFSPAGEKGVRYVLQRINRTAFPHPEDVMDNMLRVTQHLREQIVLRGGDPQRETLRLLRTQDGLFFAVDRNGDYWRSYSFVSDSVSYDRSGDERIFRESGRAFGRFLSMLDGFDAASLHETIERFHDTPHRFAALHEAVARDAAGRAGGVRDLIDLALSYEPFSSTLVDALACGRLPLRVTHKRYQAQQRSAGRAHRPRPVRDRPGYRDAPACAPTTSATPSATGPPLRPRTSATSAA